MNSNVEELPNEAELEVEPRRVGERHKGSESGDKQSIIACVYGNAVTKFIARTGKVVQWLRALIAPSEDGSLDPSTNIDDS